ncbi:pancreatic secretory granule membrane major glycoprotein GP2-like isoform X1 [Alosa alosa]|uniref:pancreatic secretory granule membrane major glycoprotein GP2-like isoform X1 n=1 Tax=Alosa alosa TaxID=278164 RepID=UPI002015201B|nr:pancreatic secretory granule membrane major glycoprotein GP2-like isoform X1 [Alosa alosa]XP_048101521.1 pancreatic secretory granule membrane major glycoprotein GP2-like isoform X1 [Alosa alosa]
MSVLKGGLLLLQMFLHTPRAAASAEESDPCHNHTVLNEAWRATTNLDHSNNKCDQSVKWLGWYRMFYLGMSVRIPEVCVPIQRCGTDAPLWLDGPHPSLEDGIVTRSVCGHWSKNCCHFKSSSIQVKTCPGNYSVYELVAPSGCSLAYCADVSSTTAPTDQLPTTPKPRTLFQQRLRLSMVLQRDLSPTEMNQMPSQVRMGVLCPTEMNQLPSQVRMGVLCPTEMNQLPSQLRMGVLCPTEMNQLPSQLRMGVLCPTEMNQLPSQLRMGVLCPTEMNQLPSQVRVGVLCPTEMNQLTNAGQCVLPNNHVIMMDEAVIEYDEERGSTRQKFHPCLGSGGS